MRSSLLSRHRPFTFCAGFVFAFYLLQDGFILIEGLSAANDIKLFFLGLLSILLFLRFKIKPFRGIPLVVLTVFILLFLQSLFMIPTSESPSSSFYGSWIFFAKGLLIFFLFYQCFTLKLIDTRTALKIWVFLGFIFSAQAIMSFLFLFLMEVNIPEYSINLSRLNMQKDISLFGFSDVLPRVQSFFSEPTKLGQFLIVPLYASRFLYRGTKRILLVSVMFLALLLTFSIAVIFAVVISTVFMEILLMKKGLYRFVAIGSVVFGMVFLAGLVIENTFLNYRGTDPLITAIAYRTVSVEDKIYQLTWGFKTGIEFPFGIGMIKPEDSLFYGYSKYNAASGILIILIQSGWVGFCFCLLIWFLLSRKLLKLILMARFNPVYMEPVLLGVAFFSLLIAGVTFGPYVDNIFVIGLATLLANWNFIPQFQTADNKV